MTHNYRFDKSVQNSSFAGNKKVLAVELEQVSANQLNTLFLLNLKRVATFNM